MKRRIFKKRLIAGILCLLFASNDVFALNAATDLIEHSSGTNPTTTGNLTNITTTHAIDTYHWGSYNLGSGEVANYIFNANGQTALNYLSPGANPSVIYGSIISSGAKGNILLFNPNGIMMGAGTSVSGANTFFASTNKFDGIINGKITFSEDATNNPLTVGNIILNGVNNAHFVAPNVSISADSINTANSFSARAIGGGEYDVNTNIFSNETGVKAPIAGQNIVDVNANITSNRITIEAKADADTYATAMISGNITANKAVMGENGEIYIIASNDTTTPTSGIQVLQNGLIGGESAKVEISTSDYVQNGNINTSGDSGGSVKITATNNINQNADILAVGNYDIGGSVEMQAKNIVSLNTATTDVSGETGGGTITESATNTLTSDATLKANCTGDNGNGGTINLYSEGLTDVSGIIEAKKGSLSGEGGMIELPTLGDLSLDANIDTAGGSIRVKRRNIVVSSNIFTPYGILPLYVEFLLLLNNVKLLADNDITVNSALCWSNSHGLTLDAGRNIAVNANITSTRGNLSFIANDVNNPCLCLSHRGSGLGGITTANGVTINTGTANINFLTEETGSTYLAADTIIGSDINTNNFTAQNDGAGKDINLTGNLVAQGLATFVATDISISNPAYAFGGFDIDAVGSVATSDLITTDATHTGADVAIEANEGSLNGTSITTGDIDAGNKFVFVNLDNTTNNSNGLVTIGDITAGGSSADTAIYVGNDNSSLTSGISLNSFNTTGIAFINGMLVHDVNIADTSTSGGEMSIYSGANLTTQDLKSTATGAAIFLVGNINSANTTNANLITGKLEAASGNIAVVMENNTNNIATMTVGNVETNSLFVLNLDTSAGSDITLLNDLTAPISIELWSYDTIHITDSTLTSDKITTSSKIVGDTLNLIANTLDITPTTKGDVTNVSFQRYTPTDAILNSQIKSLLDNITMDNLYLGSSTQIGDISDAAASALAFGDTVVSAETKGNLYLNSSDNLNVDTIKLDGSVPAKGNATLKATGDITQTTGSAGITINGTTNLTAGNDIKLDSIHNDFTGAVSVVAGGSAEINDQNGLLMGLSDIADSLTLTTGGDITQNAKIQVGNDTNLNTLGKIIFDNSDNDFCYDTTKDGVININGTSAYLSGMSSSSSIAADSAIIKDSSNVQLGNINIADGLQLIILGSVTQKADGVTLNILAGESSIIASKDIKIYNAVIGSPSSTATIKLKAGYTPPSSTILANGLADVGVVPYDLELVTATINGVLEAEATHDINVTGTTTGTANGAFTFNAGHDVNIGTLGQSTPTEVITGGAALTVTAGGSFNMIGNSPTNPTLIDTTGNVTNGNVIITANNGSDFSDTAGITMLGNTLINAGSGSVIMTLLDNAETNTGKMTLNNINAGSIRAENQSLGVGTDVIINGVLATTETTPNPLIVASDNGNFINNKGSDALVTDPTQRWLVYSGSPADTTLGGLVPANTYYSSTIENPTPDNVPAGNSVLYRTPNPSPGGGGGGGGAGGAIAGGTVGGAAAAGAAGGFYGAGLLPGLILGLASPIQFDESMIDIIDKSRDVYPLLVRNMQYVFQTSDISKLDPNKIGSSRFIPDSIIENGSYELVKVKIPAEFANAPKGVTVRITQKSLPFGVHNGIPDMNFNVFNVLSDKQINSMYATRRFLKPKYLAKRVTPLRANRQIEGNNGIIQKTVLVGPNQTKNDLSIAVNYLKNGKFPRKNASTKLDKQTYSLVVQFVANE